MSRLARAGPGAAPDGPAVESQIQELLAYGERVRAELGAIEEQRQILAEVLQDYARGREALRALENATGDEEVLVPVGGGNYVSARLANASRVVTSIGSGLHVDATVADALKRLDSRAESATKASERLAEESRKLADEMSRLNQHLQVLSQGGGLGEG